MTLALESARLVLYQSASRWADADAVQRARPGRPGQVPGHAGGGDGDHPRAVQVVGGRSAHRAIRSSACSATCGPPRSCHPTRTAPSRSSARRARHPRRSAPRPPRGLTRTEEAARATEIAGILEDEPGPWPDWRRSWAAGGRASKPSRARSVKATRPSRFVPSDPAGAVDELAAAGDRSAAGARSSSSTSSTSRAARRRGAGDCPRRASTSIRSTSPPGTHRARRRRPGRGHPGRGRHGGDDAGISQRTALRR